MLNKYPLWKYLLILTVVIVGAIYSTPNFYPDDPVVQISGADAVIEVDDLVLKRATKALDEAGVSYFAPSVDKRAGVVRFQDTETQLVAKDIVEAALGERYVVALNLAETTPDWLVSLGAGPMKLGLDLRGGVHFLLEVDIDKALDQRHKSYVSEIKQKLREEKIRYRSVSADLETGIRLVFKNNVSRDKASDLLRDQYRAFIIQDADEGDEFILSLALTDSKIKEIQDYAISQNLTTIRNRVNEIGVAEPLVQRQGTHRIVVELPGVQDTAAAKRIIGRTATLEFRLVDWEHDASSARGGRAPAGSELMPFKNDVRPPVLLKRRIIVSGDRVLDARSNYDENGRPQVNITLDGRGGKKMSRVTTDHVKDDMAVVFVETKSKMVEKKVDGQKQLVRETWEEKYVINRATIQSALGVNFRITGLDSPLESSELALMLRAGALAAPMYFVEERTVGPSLGQENIDAGKMSVQLGFMAVMLFMVAYYRVFGLIANMALAANVMLLVAGMSMLSATLTLPGIAGIVLTVGMAVDANVLIFARIREELANGLPPQAAINSGFDRAFVTIFDANITTFIVAVILFAFGTGPVKGFAVTLSIGILTSMFTAVLGTRALVNLFYGSRQLTTLRV
ncbi:MAG: protein translocase subunit SecD [Pseudomonadales bacterium]|nr:protein translocase subunit SecD [Pseudomonadales bacterium]